MSEPNATTDHPLADNHGNQTTGGIENKSSWVKFDDEDLKSVSFEYYI